MPSRVAFYTDSHIPTAIARQLRIQLPEIQIVRAQEIGVKDADDDDHWQIVMSN